MIGIIKKGRLEMITYTKETLHKHWSTGERILVNGVNCRVGKMSYGQYFLEPGQEGKETEPFNKGTLWLTKIKEGYAIE